MKCYCYLKIRPSKNFINTDKFLGNPFMTDRIKAVDIVVNIWTKEAMDARPKTTHGFFVGKVGVAEKTYKGISLEDMLRKTLSSCEMSF